MKDAQVYATGMEQSARLAVMMDAQMVLSGEVCAGVMEERTRQCSHEFCKLPIVLRREEFAGGMGQMS